MILSPSQPVALWMEYTDPDGKKHEAHIPTAFIRSASAISGELIFEIQPTGEWTVRSSEQPEPRHLKENA